MLSYLKGPTGPEIPMAVHQRARFCNNPCLVHGCAIRRITKYLAIKSTYVDLTDRNLRLTTHRTVYRLDIEKGIECYVDSDHAGGWTQEDAANSENVMSCMVITYAGCSALWNSKLKKRYI